MIHRRHRRKTDDRIGPAVAVILGGHPPGTIFGDPLQQDRIGDMTSGRKDRADQDHAGGVDEHRMARRAEPDRIDERLQKGFEMEGGF